MPGAAARATAAIGTAAIATAADVVTGSVTGSVHDIVVDTNTSITRAANVIADLIHMIIVVIDIVATACDCASLPSGEVGCHLRQFQGRAEMIDFFLFIPTH